MTLDIIKERGKVLSKIKTTKKILLNLKTLKTASSTPSFVIDKK
jgi:hypothetical protein